MARTHITQTRNLGSGRESISGPSLSDLRCPALHEDGSDCHHHLLRPHHDLCHPHHREYKELYKSYKDLEQYYGSLGPRDGEDGARAEVEAKLAAGKKTLQLRDQVNRRFFNLATNNRGHVKWILKLQSELRNLESRLATLDAEASTGPVAPPQEDAPVFQSLLDPEVPMSALSHLPDSHPGVVIKRVVHEMVTQMVEKLYSIAPSLDDSTSLVLDVTGEKREPNARDFVIRFLFRELLIYKADADELVRASRTSTISLFLRKSTPDHLRDYIKFFTVFNEARSDTFCLLRDAVCDYLLGLQQPSASPSPATSVLGAEILTDDSQRRMDMQGWDILWGYFYDKVHWSTLELFATNMDDVVTVKTLTALLRYGSIGRSDEDDPRSWYFPDEDISQECQLAVMQGFIAVTKGFREPGMPSITIKPGTATERQAHCYLVGRMSKKNPWARQLAQELSERLLRFQVLVIDREDGTEEPPMPSSLSSDDNPWITRSRTAPTDEALNSQPWTVEWSLNNVLNDVRQFYNLRDRNMDKAYYDFVIIDRHPGRAFDILDIVAFALLQLKGDPPHREVFRQAIQKCVAVEKEDKYLELVAGMDFPRAAPPLRHQYIGNRIRCWDIPDPFRAHTQALSRDPLTLSESRFIARSAADLESHGATTLLTAYEPPRSCPVVVPGIDGLDDVYFPFDLGPMNERALRGTMLDPARTPPNLADFAAAYQRRHPAAVFAKGRIHVHYCAWPMLASEGHLRPHLVFATPEGRLYRWKALPFDVPLASRMWQAFVDHEVNKKLLFARLVQTTLVVCAESREGAQASLDALLDVGERHGWSFSVPLPAQWTADVGGLGLGSLWEGVGPAILGSSIEVKATVRRP